jgi:hypothetical protein
MKKLAFASALFFLFTVSVAAQGKFGLRLGLSSQNLDMKDVTSEGVSIALKDANYGYHFGLFARAHLGERFFIQPEVLFNSSSVDYEVNDFSNGFVKTVFKESYRNLDIPVLLGWKFGPLRLNAGPVGHVYMASKSELEEEGGYDRRFNNLTVGYQAGLGLDIWKFLVDVKYEGNFNSASEDINIGGEEIEFSEKPSRWILSLGYAF